MALGPGDKAFMFALGGLARGGATRGGYVSGRIYVFVNGVDRTTAVDRDAQFSIDDETNETPNQCNFQTEGVIVTRGDEIVINRGSKNSVSHLFAGHAVTATKTFIQRGAIGSVVEAQDYRVLLKGILVTAATYVGQSLTAILIDLLSRAPGFKTRRIALNLPVVDAISFVNTPLDQAINQAVAQVKGAHWDVDENKFVYAFVSDPDGIAPRDLTYDEPTLESFSYEEDDSQTVNRCIVTGAGANLTQPAAAGATVLFVDGIDPFSGAGGSLQSADGQVITYGGRSPAFGTSKASARPVPADPLWVRLPTGASTPDATGAWQVEVTFEYSDGQQSLPSPADTITLTGPNDGFTTSSLPIGDARVTKRHIYYKKPGDTFKEPAIVSPVNNNTATTSSLDAKLNGGTTAPPSTAANYAAGSTFIYVDDITQFSLTGGTVLYGASRTFTYTAGALISGTVGVLTGIPSSGAGAIAATITIGDSLAYQPTNLDYYLTGVPATGAGSIAGVASQTDVIQPRPAPPDPGVTRLATGAATPDATGAWQIAVAFGYSDGTESLPSPADTITITGPNDGFTIPLPLGDANVTKRYVYFKKPGDTFKRPTTGGVINNNTATSIALDAQLGGGTTAPQSTAANYPAGSTYIYVTAPSKFITTGGSVQYGSGTPRVFNYGRSDPSTVGGVLTGIPPSGSGSIAVTINVGDIVTSLSTGIGLAKGTALSLYAQKDDVAAQAAVAARYTTATYTDSGIRASVINDSSLSQAEAEALAQATVDLQSPGIATATYQSRDTRTRAGRIVHVNIVDPISGVTITDDLRIQRATLTELATQMDEDDVAVPAYQVTAANQRFSLEDLIRRQETR